MDAALKSKIVEVFSKYHFSDEDAGFLSQVLEGIDTRQEREFRDKMDRLLTQKDKTELIDRIERNKSELIERMEGNKSELIDRIEGNKSELIDRIEGNKSELIGRIQSLKSSLTSQIYLVGLVQFLAIVSAVLAIISFMLK